MTRPDSRSDLDDLLPDLGVADALRQRPAGIGSARHAIRIAIAVTVSWVVAEAVSRSEFALFAPITTLLVVQTSPWTTLGVSVQRIMGTGLGVLVASVWVNVVGLSWWSFLAGVLAALLIARLLPWSLGGQLQIPVAVVFVLAIGPGSIQQDAWRVLDVIIGGAIGLFAVFVFPPRPRPDAFEAAMCRYRDAIVETLRSVGAESGTLPMALGPGEVHAFVSPSRRLRDRADDARDALVRLVEGSQLNMRAGQVPAELDARALRLRRLSGIGVQVRGIVGAANRLYDQPGLEPSLDHARLAPLVDQVVELMDLVLGVGDEPVGRPSGALLTSSRRPERTAATTLDRELSVHLRRAADDVAEQHAQVGDVLASVSMLGRLDHIRSQLASFPEWEA